MTSLRPWTPTRWVIGSALALGLIGVAVPARTSSAGSIHPELTRLRLQWQELCCAAEAFRRDHGHWPGLDPAPALHPAASVARLRADLLEPKQGRPPYLSSWPQNPVSASGCVRLLDGLTPSADDPRAAALAREPGWTWRPHSGTFKPDPRGFAPGPHDIPTW